MIRRRDELRVDPRAGQESGRDLRQELRNLDTRGGVRGFVPWVVAAGVVTALNVAWLMGSVRPRVEGLEKEVEVARVAEENALRESALMSVRLESLDEIVDYSARYRIPADLARDIFEIALSEDLEPDLAFRLVQTESSFRRHALSEAGAVGYTQILPSTARWLEPGVRDEDLYDRETNLRLGFRYLRLLLDENGGEMRLALLAYNRGPGTVRSIVARGGNPENGYAARIMGSE